MYHCRPAMLLDKTSGRVGFRLVNCPGDSVQRSSPGTTGRRRTESPPLEFGNFDKDLSGSVSGNEIRLHPNDCSTLRGDTLEICHEWIRGAHFRALRLYGQMDRGHNGVCRSESSACLAFGAWLVVWVFWWVQRTSIIVFFEPSSVSVD
jgi:hypothetical protein